ncbi:MAG: hypothetical protein QOI13_3379 [Paraburkholderia sp.]|nr:hypothetical protein [Paraburkholderia sp.]
MTAARDTGKAMWETNKRCRSFLSSMWQLEER